MVSSESTRRSSIAGIASILTLPYSSTATPPQLKNRPQVITPKIQENQLGESIQFRSQILPDLKDLGPPDLIHISKYDKSTKQEIGEYHYATGLNTSSVIQPFMYLQTIQLNDKQPASTKHIKVGTYCSYNCFSKGDLRIRCQFPGSSAPMVQFVPCNKSKITISIGTEGEKHQTLWLETFVSSLIRSLLFSDSVERQLPGMCEYNPIQSTKDAKEAIQSMCNMIPKGPIIGCSDLINRATHCDNFLIDALIKLLEITEYYDFALNEIKKLSNKGYNLNVLIVRILIKKHDSAKSVRLMHDSLFVSPRDGWMLTEQAKFLIEQDRPDLALIPAVRSVECLPTEFVCWKTLILVYILQKDFANALLALNSSPMYTNKRKDIYSALKPKNFEFPLPLEGKLDNIWKDCETFGCISGTGGIIEFSNMNEIESLNGLHLQVYEQTKLNCTFKEAYDLLAIISKQIGWSELLRIRSNVFVMEDEYNESVQIEQQRELKENLAASSVGGIFQNGNKTKNPDENGNNNDGNPNPNADEIDVENQQKNKKSLNVLSNKNGSLLSLSNISSKFKSKRLSEKWLDSLFLIFYENLKSVLIWENEKLTGENNQHSAIEWELIGDESFKVHHYKSGIIPFKTSLNERFSIFSCYTILNYYLYTLEHQIPFFKLNGITIEEKDSYMLDNDYVLKLSAKLISWKYRYYGEFSIVCFRILKKLMDMRDSDSTVLKSKLEFLFGQIDEKEKKGKDDKESEKSKEESKQSITGLVDRYISWLEQFNE